MHIESEAVVITVAVLLIQQISGSRHSLIDPGTVMDPSDLVFSGTTPNFWCKMHFFMIWGYFP